ncbi:zinc metalloproteinase-disintegrin-like 4a isoform X1 [Osmerus eperlanus]|uniref:zinc metalloproteinase-disintegrin-like 4a isoform X1 n=1 Tax=Osmerus eperlanus TaxID=29151 RepID=UPI002E1296CA
MLMIEAGLRCSLLIYPEMLLSSLQRCRSTSFQILRLNMLLIFYTLLLCLLRGPLVSSTRNQNYDIVRPYRLSVRVRRNIFTKQVYPDEIRYALTIDGSNHTIHLERNRNLIGKDYVETYYSEDGSRMTTSPNSEDHCYYHGHIQGVEDSSVNVGICAGISGSVRLRQQVYLIEPLEHSADGDHALYKQEHLQTNSSSCGLINSTTFYDHDHNDPNLNPNYTHYDHDQTPVVAGLFKSRLWKTQSILSQLSRESPRIIELYLVVDNAEYKLYGDQTTARMMEIVNHVDKLYRSLNIRVMLVGMEIWTNKDLIDIDRDSDKTLDRFILWRKKDLLKRVKHDNAQLVTGIDFQGDTVGLANVFTMCTESSAGINQDHQTNYIGLASTMAHEIGHNLGMSHDSNVCSCGISTYCVMAEKIRSSYPETFSSCSQEKLRDFLERALPRCLLERPTSDRLFMGVSCGNAYLDHGEECDCGTVEECKNPCCDAATCRLTRGSLCAHGTCCEDCQLKQAASVCRPSASECDLAEYCTGISEHCPGDDFQMNGTPCDYGQGYCYDGHCPTYQLHCRRLFGPAATVAEDFCFGLNSEGKEGANCGKSVQGSYKGCARQNQKCGSLFCASNEASITGRKIVFTFPLKGQCLVAFDEDKTRNLDMVPTGTKCGPYKVCYENKCLDVSVYGTNEQCSKKCNNNGVCDHKKECHCHPGWAPPFCEVRYSDLPQGQGVFQGVVIAGILTAAILLLITLVVGGWMFGKKYKRGIIFQRKMHTSPGLLNPTTKEGTVNGRPLNKPQISLPTFLESSATQARKPQIVMVPPTHPPPQPPKKVEHSPTHTDTYIARKPSPPPVPPVKPCVPPLPPVKPCVPPLPPVKPRVPPLPQVKPCGPPLPPQA